MMGGPPAEMGKTPAQTRWVPTECGEAASQDRGGEQGNNNNNRTNCARRWGDTTDDEGPPPVRTRPTMTGKCHQQGVTTTSKGQQP